MQGFRLRENYDIEELLGSGGFGVVFRAKNRTNNKYYAVKLIGGTDDVVEETSLEIETFSRLPPHKNIVTYYSSWTENVSKSNITQLMDEFKISHEKFKIFNKAHDNASLPMICIEMELCEGDLRDWIQKSKNVSMKQRNNIILQIAGGIQHLHDNKIIHRDLKPDNIFVNCKGDDYTVKIGDFGISKQHQGTRDVAHTLNIGTAIYCAPEITGSNYGRKIDWYSLGLIIFEMFYPDMQPKNSNSGTFDELSACFTQLRYERKLPLKLKLAWPKVAQLIVKLTEVKSDNRGDFNDVKTALGPLTPIVAASIENEVVLAAAAAAPIKVLPKSYEKEKYILLKKEFAIKKLLGTGSYGAVFQVRSRNSNKKYAIKWFAETTDLEECLKEVKNYEQIPRHKNVVRYFASWNEGMITREVDDLLQRFDINNNERFKVLHNIGGQHQLEFLCIQMELCSGDLRNWLKANQEVDEDKCADIFSQIAEGTQHLHQNKLIHRDLKPDNIFLKKDVIKIGDLGISKWHTSTKSAQHTTNFGTMLYLAPEMQCAQYGKMVDWWAAGLILFELFHPKMQMSSVINPLENVIKGFNELKFQRKLPDILTDSWPHVADLILSLTDSNTLERGGYQEIRDCFKTTDNNNHNPPSPPPPPRHELLRKSSIIPNVVENNPPRREVSKVESNPLRELSRLEPKVVTLKKSFIHIKCTDCDEIVDRELSYKCVDCYDIDLCQNCYKISVKKKKHDQNHNFVLMYLEMQCKNCNGKFDRFSGYQCVKCISYDLCTDCYTKEKKLHLQHRFVKYQAELKSETKVYPKTN